jgi:hypothetical protein
MPATVAMNRTSFTIIAIESIVIFLLCLLLFNNCQDKKQEKKDTKISKVTEYKYYPKWYPLALTNYVKGDSVIVEKPSVIDTQAVINSYYKRYTFNDSISDTNIIINSQVIVAKNIVEKSLIKYKLLQPMTSTTVTIEKVKETKPRPIILVGADIGFNKTRFISEASPGLIFITKKRQAFGTGYDLLNETYQAKCYLPIYK